MITYREYIKNFSYTAETELMELWDILVKFKKLSQSNNINLNPDEIVNFQYKLTQLLNKVTKLFYELTYRRKALNKQQKKMVHSVWYNQNKELNKLLEFLNFLMVIIKSIGDAFIFIFYSHDREYLNRHLEVPPLQLTIPSGVGGMGEVEFVKNFKMLNDQLVIYHGITNILRIGDFTLFNLKEGKVTAVGELKSGMPDEKTLNFNLTIIGHKNSKINFDEPSETGFAERQDEPFKLPNKERYEKQVKAMIDSFSYLDENNKKDEINSKTFFSKPKFEIMAELANISSNIPMAYIQANQSLLLARQAYKGDTIFERFMSETKESELDTNEMIKHYRNILSPQVENNIAFGQIHFNAKLRIQPQLGTKPIFWYPISFDVLKKIYFGEVIFFTVYNFGFLTQAMKDKGYDYGYSEIHKENGFIKKHPDMNYFVSGIDFFVKMITEYLQDEVVVVECITSVAEESYQKVKGSGKPGKTSMNIILH